MEDLKKLEIQILELLGSHQCVTVPGLGSFIYREFPASSNHFTFELKPSGNTVFFNNAIQADDGILANAIRETEGMDYAGALRFIKNTVSAIESNLEVKKNLAFGKLGNFFLNADQQVFFLPSGNLNLSLQSFGLPSLRLEELTKSAPTSTVNTKPEVVSMPVSSETKIEETDFEDAEILEVEDQHKNRGLVWKIAAGFAIVTLSATGWYFGKQYFGNGSHPKTQASAMDVSTNKTESTEAEPTPSTAENTAANTSEVPATKKAIKSVKEIKPAEKNAEKTDKAIINRPAEVKALIVSSQDYSSAMQQKSGKFYLMGGTFIGEEMAKSECKKWNNVGVNATIFKPGNSSLFRVILGRFQTEKAASDFMQTMPGFHGSTVSMREISIFK